MFTQGKKKGTILFAVKPSCEARIVQLTGDFQDWKPMPMRKARDGSFEAQVPLQMGKYQYKFIVDGQWMADPDNSATMPNKYGTLNSIAAVQ